LRQVGIEPDRVVATDIDEGLLKDETPRIHAVRLARAKAEAGAAAAPGAFVVGADTVVAVGRRVLPKAETQKEARDCFKLLSGRAHKVLTAVAVIAPDGRCGSRLVETRVRFKRLTAQETEGYLESDEWRGKAGGYGVQGRAGAFVTDLAGSYSAVVGLPLYETLSLLQGLGWRP
jgi:septum formation protein